jgi:hypothetical protein
LEVRVGFDIEFHCPKATPAVLMLRVHPERSHDLVGAEHLQLSSLEPVHHYHDTFGNICSRIVAPAGRVTLRGDALLRDHGQPDPVALSAEEIPIARLSDNVLLFLMGSRYCETDERCRAGPGSRRFATLCITTSGSRIRTRVRPAPRCPLITSAAASAATSPIWPSRYAAR